MKRAFISLIEVGSDTDLLGFAEDVQNDLTAAGYDVEYTHPWNAEASSTVPPLIPAPPLPLAPPPLSTRPPHLPTANPSSF